MSPRPGPEVIAAVQRSYAAVADRPVRLAESFYAHLFDMAPHLRPMFPADLTAQMQMMSDQLLDAIARLDTPDTAQLETTLRKLGARHRKRYHVEPEHYLYIGHALTRAVRDVSGPDFSGSLSSSWIAVYQWIADQMTAGGHAADAGTMGSHPPVELPQQRPASERGLEPAAPVRERYRR